MSQPTALPRLYAILEVPATATQAAIRKSYHRLALTCHPDKVGEAGAEEFKLINEAYHILGDAGRRATYDKYGEQGVGVMENDVAAPMMNAFGNHVLLTAFALGLLFFLSCCIITSASVAARVDGVVAWSWADTMWGVWLWDAGVAVLMAIYVGAMIQAQLADGDDAPPLQVQQFAALAVGVLYIAWTALVAVGLDGSDGDALHDNALYVFVPLFAAEAILLVGTVPGLAPARIAEDLVRQFGSSDAASVAAVFQSRLAVALQRLVFGVLVALRTDRHTTASWHVVMVPTYATFLALLVGGFVSQSLGVANGSLTQGQRAMGFVWNFLWFGATSASYALVAEKLDRDGEGPATLAVCLIPFYCQLAFGWLLAAFSACAAANAADDDLQEMEEAQSREPV